MMSDAHHVIVVFSRIIKTISENIYCRKKKGTMAFYCFIVYENIPQHDFRLLSFRPFVRGKSISCNIGRFPLWIYDFGSSSSSPRPFSHKWAFYGNYSFTTHFSHLTGAQQWASVTDHVMIGTFHSSGAWFEWTRCLFTLK